MSFACFNKGPHFIKCPSSAIFFEYIMCEAEPKEPNDPDEDPEDDPEVYIPIVVRATTKNQFFAF
jgi:hypothetical protein